ncbi:hypothetical protein QC762_0100870 [Podospora pseudocomata]|uniref:Uncharacterized protein n=1 Tax=Podospora pseudocomata TaxID=2093779 RepID=A0ABR0G907_9PEZI|nr:hypothetical protein QC762_0100870 [Podospora pseudocomata]
MAWAFGFYWNIWLGLAEDLEAPNPVMVVGTETGTGTPPVAVFIREAGNRPLLIPLLQEAAGPMSSS